MASPPLAPTSKTRVEDFSRERSTAKPRARLVDQKALMGAAALNDAPFVIEDQDFVDHIFAVPFADNDR